MKETCGWRELSERVAHGLEGELSGWCNIKGPWDGRRTWLGQTNSSGMRSSICTVHTYIFENRALERSRCLFLLLIHDPISKKPEYPKYETCSLLTSQYPRTTPRVTQVIISPPYIIRSDQAFPIQDSLSSFTQSPSLHQRRRRTYLVPFISPSFGAAFMRSCFMRLRLSALLIDCSDVSLSSFCRAAIRLL